MLVIFCTCRMAWVMVPVAVGHAISSLCPGERTIAEQLERLGRHKPGPACATPAPSPKIACRPPDMTPKNISCGLPADGSAVSLGMSLRRAAFCLPNRIETE